MSPHVLPDRQLLSLKEAARYLRVSEATLRRKIARREIAYFKPGGRLQFDPADLDAYLRAARVERMSRSS